MNENARINACTLFDSNFMYQGLTMINSVIKNSKLIINWTVLALDEITFDTLCDLNLPNTSIVNIESLRDEELSGLKNLRNWNELCWTAASCLLSKVVEKSQTGEISVYIDADCFFYGDISKSINELFLRSEITIHAHNFSPDRIHWMKKSGIYNVGLVGGKKGPEFQQCLERWRRQVLNECIVDKDAGKCGDQTYLNEWPDLYSNLSIMDSSHSGLGPWNLNNYNLRSINKVPYNNAEKIIFFHFHAMQIGKINSFFWAFIPAAGYSLNKTNIIHIYKPYINALKDIYILLNNSLLDSRFKKSCTWYLKGVLRLRLFLVFFQPANKSISNFVSLYSNKEYINRRYDY